MRVSGREKTVAKRKSDKGRCTVLGKVCVVAQHRHTRGEAPMKTKKNDLRRARAGCKRGDCCAVTGDGSKVMEVRLHAHEGGRTDKTSSHMGQTGAETGAKRVDTRRRDGHM